jgi:anti-sigma B factor antagonist
MQIERRQVGDVDVLVPIGKLSSVEHPSMRPAVQESMERGIARVVVNFERVTSADSMGIGDLSAANVAAHNAGATIKLCCVSEKMIKILEITQIINLFDVYDTEAEAIASFPR